MREQIGPFFCRLVTAPAKVCSGAQSAVLQGEAYAAQHDNVRAFEQYRLAAEQGHAEAQYRLGVCYANGKGVRKDTAEAAAWYRKAAEQGHAEAQYRLGVCYANGYGVKKDLAQAIEWYRKAAKGKGLAKAALQRMERR